MNLHLLKIYVCAVEENSFTKAGSKAQSSTICFDFDDKIWIPSLEDQWGGLGSREWGGGDEDLLPPARVLPGR